MSLIPGSGKSGDVEEELATYSSILAWKIPGIEEPNELQSMVSQIIGHTCSTEHTGFYNLLLLFSRSVMSNSLWPHGLQHARLSCPSLSPGVWSNSCPLSQWCCPTISSSVTPFSSCPQSFLASRSFLSESALCIKWPKYWSFSFSISPSNEYSRLISFRIDWFDLLSVQGTLKRVLQYHSSKVPILWRLAFFMVQLSHPYMTTGKIIAFTIGTFVDNVMSLLFNMLSRFVMLLSSKEHSSLILWLQPLSAVILEPKKIMSVTISTFYSSICHDPI